MTNMLPLKPYMFGHAAHLHKLVMDWRLLSGGQNDRKSGFNSFRIVVIATKQFNCTITT